MNNSYRLLVITSTFPRWKDDTEPPFVFELSKHMASSGFEVDVLAPRTSGSMRYQILDSLYIHRYPYFISRWEVLAYSGGILANLKKNRLNYLLVPFFLIAQLSALLNCLKKKDYDLIHAHWIIPQGLICALANIIRRKRKVPILCTSHGGDLFALGGIFNWLKVWTIKHCKHITVVSEEMKIIAISMGVPEDKITVLPMGIDTRNTFKEVPNTKRLQNRIIFVGRLVEKKGVAHLVKAISILKKQLPDIELLIVGDGPLLDKLRTMTDDLGLTKNVIIYGAVKHDMLPALYSSAKVAVIPSVIDRRGDQEGLGLVVVEAMACGCAVVASCLEAIKDVVEDGENGLLVEPGNPEAIAAAVTCLLTDEDFSVVLIRNGIKTATERFDWCTIAQRYRNVLIDIA